MTKKKTQTLAERAAISRRLAEAHYNIAAEAKATADKLLEDAIAMEGGIDPFDHEPEANK